MRLSIPALALGAFLTWPAASMADSINVSDMTTAEREAFRAEVRAYLLENPEVIFEAIRILEDRREMAGREADRKLVASFSKELFDDGFSYVGGNPDGDITIVEFVDYRCGYCKRAHPEVQELLERDPNVRLVLKEFPILGPDSVHAGKMALAALQLDPERYHALNDELMNYDGNLTEEAAYLIAGDTGFDIAALKAAASSADVDDLLNKNYQLAQALGLQGTPAFVIGDTIIRGYLPVDEMLEVVKGARAQD